MHSDLRLFRASALYQSTVAHSRTMFAAGETEEMVDRDDARSGPQCPCAPLPETSRLLALSVEQRPENLKAARTSDSFRDCRGNAFPVFQAHGRCLPRSQASSEPRPELQTRRESRT